MAATVETLKLMEPAHAIRTIRADEDPLTRTALESFLLDLVEPHCTVGAAEVMAAVDGCGYTADEISSLGAAQILSVDNTCRLLDTLTERGIDNPGELEKLLALADKSRELFLDAGDIFARAADLTTTTNQE